MVPPDEVGAGGGDDMVIIEEEDAWLRKAFAGIFKVELLLLLLLLLFELIGERVWIPLPLVSFSSPTGAEPLKAPPPLFPLPLLLLVLVMRRDMLAMLPY